LQPDFLTSGTHNGPPQFRINPLRIFPVHSADGIAAFAAELARILACLIATGAFRTADDDLLRSVP